MTLYSDLITAGFSPPSASGPGSLVRHVTLSGSDNSDGLTWQTAKRTVAGAVNSLPEIGTSGDSNYRRAGRVYIGSGEFVETDTPILVNEEVQFFGQGTSTNGGTVVKLGNAQNTHLFSYDATFTDWAHHVIFSDMRLDGNKANNAGAYDIVRLKKPGFNCGMYNVYLQNAPRYGIYIDNNAVNFYTFNCSGGGCNTGWLYVNFATSANQGNLAFYGTQIDNCGADAAIHIYSVANGNNHVAFYGLETEAIGTGASLHTSVIKYYPAGGSNGVTIIADQVSSHRETSGGTAILYEDNDTGASIRHMLRSVSRNGYDAVFVSGKTSNRNITSVVGSAQNQDCEFASTSTGPVLRDTNGVRYRLGVNTSGVLTVTSL